MGESAARPDVPAPDDEAVDEAVDETLRELLAASRAEEPYEPPVVFMSWYRRVSGLL